MQQKGMADIASIYASKPLEADKQQIRLLALDRDENGINGLLRVFDVSKPVSWIALSYCWASYGFNDETCQYDELEEDSQRQSIQLDGMDFPVRDNLWRALNALLDLRDNDRCLEANQGVPTYDNVLSNRSGVASPTHGSALRLSLARTHWFWIDAVCIAQDSILERNHQVGLMASIYSGAERIVAWLDASPCVNQVFDFLRNPYWDRMWIVQEVILASKLEILHGGRCYNGDGIDSLMSQIRVLRHRKTDRDKTRSARSYGSSDLQDLLVRHGSNKCKDPRDKVYALLGLLPEDFPIKADYGLSTRDLFTAVVRTRPDRVTDCYYVWGTLGLGDTISERSEVISHCELAHEAALCKLRYRDVPGRGLGSA